MSNLELATIVASLMELQEQLEQLREAARAKPAGRHISIAITELEGVIFRLGWAVEL